MKKKPQEDPMHALWSGDAHAIDKLFKTPKFNPNQADVQGRTLLMEVVLEKRADLVKLLLDHGADPKLQDRDGWTALHFAAEFHLPDVVQMLLDKGAVIDARDHHGNTPLFKALSTYRGQADGNAIWALVLSGADKTVKNTHLVSPEDLSKGISSYDLGQFFR